MATTTMTSKELHQNKFEEWISEKYRTKKTSISITKKEYKRIKKALMTNFHDYDKSFKKRIWINREMRLANDEITGRALVTAPVKFNKDKIRCPLAVIDEWFDIIYQKHYLDINHDGQTKTRCAVFREYSGIPRAAINEFCRLCSICNMTHKNNNKASVKPIE